MASTDVLVHINMNGNEIQNVLAQKLATAPSNPSAGQFYFNTNDNTLYVYDGTTWKNALAQGTTYQAGTGINSTSLAAGTIAVSTTVASKTDIGSANLTIQRNGTGIGTFSANATSPTTVNISVPTAATDIGAVPTSRTINGKSLTANVTLTAADVSALPSTTVIGDADITIQRNGTAIGTINANQTSAGTINISVPTTATEVGALPASTTIADLVTTTQLNAINSGATTTNIGQIATNTSGIAAINSLIPSATTTTNPLADKAFVNSSVQTATANFRGNWATWADVPTAASSYPEDYAGSKTPTVNDYLVVQDASGYTGQTLSGTWRFKYSGTWSTDGKAGWLPEYQVNETPMTAAQLAAINSGITAAGVTQIATNTTAIAGKQDTLTAGANITIRGNTISATNTVYTLPIASTSTLGGIKVGNNLTIASDGTLAASIDTSAFITSSSTNTLTNKTIDADDNTISDLTTSNFKSGTLQTTVRVLGTASDTAIPTEKAVRNSLDNLRYMNAKSCRCIQASALTSTGGVCTWTITFSGLDGNSSPLNVTFKYPPNVDIYDYTSGKRILTDVEVTTTTATVKFNSASTIAANTYMAIITGCANGGTNTGIN